MVARAGRAFFAGGGAGVGPGEVVGRERQWGGCVCKVRVAAGRASSRCCPRCMARPRSHNLQCPTQKPKGVSGCICGAFVTRLHAPAAVNPLRSALAAVRYAQQRVAQLRPQALRTCPQRVLEVLIHVLIIDKAISVVLCDAGRTGGTHGVRCCSRGSTSRLAATQQAVLNVIKPRLLAMRAYLINQGLAKDSPAACDSV